MKILFLTNNIVSITLFQYIKNKEKDVILFEAKLSKENIIEIKPDLIISYNYRYIISREIINIMNNRVINLHISYLPFNRGAYPNVWSFLDDTPKGVTIHLIDEGIDTGDIICQKEVIFENEDEETLRTSYNKLHREIQNLFIDNYEDIKSLSFNPKKQPHFGTIHYIKDFEKIKHLLGDEGWDIKIKELKIRYNRWLYEQNNL
jgi:methionyl-tRNA formyltransferase